jgi:hypothetical protein
MADNLVERSAACVVLGLTCPSQTPIELTLTSSFVSRMGVWSASKSPSSPTETLRPAAPLPAADNPKWASGGVGFRSAVLSAVVEDGKYVSDFDRTFCLDLYEGKLSERPEIKTDKECFVKRISDRGREGEGAEPGDGPSFAVAQVMTASETATGLRQPTRFKAHR